ncbi:DUF6387 family protein [Paraburkholderia bannensis]|uniref:DUF6387 family protein n=1 Tax=Paraburkholderia bannensis TaxID=765414 RepID=UPI002AC327D9|nr:DUF6387 family protein [Paraburkholderia bannensis]
MARNFLKPTMSPPSEFDIEKYADTENFSIEDWARSVANRVWMLRNRDSLRRAGADHDPEYRKIFLDEAINVLNDPMALNNGDLEGLGNQINPEDKLVKDMDVLDGMILRGGVARIEGTTDKFAAYDEMFERWHHLRSSEDDDAQLRTPYWRIVFATPAGRNTAATHGHIHASVNLHASEQRIVADFVKWLRQTKTELGIPAKRSTFTKADLNRWHRNRVLAYFDVTYWISLAGVEISDYLLGTALFPEDDPQNPADKVRKTVRPSANELFTPTMSAALVDQACDQCSGTESELA